MRVSGVCGGAYPWFRDEDCLAGQPARLGVVLNRGQVGGGRRWSTCRCNSPAATDPRGANANASAPRQGVLGR